jgi:VWFA-related protein
MTKQRRGVAACICALALGLPAPAQAPKPAQKTETPVIRTTTRLVQVSVIVQDKHGRPVTDLTRSDFVLLDDGQPQAISVFSMESSRPLPVRDEPLPPNTFTNRLDRHSGVPTSVTVVLFDGLNTSFHDKAYAKDQVIKFIRKLQPQDRVALYALSNSGVRVLHDFTSDPEPLLRALARYVDREEHQVSGSDPTVDQTGIEEIDQFFREAMERQANFYLTDRVHRTVEGLSAIANHLARLPGRKNLVWISSAFPVSFGQGQLQYQQNLSPERGLFTGDIERAARALNDANLAIYPVDARGLMGPFAFGPRGTARIRTLGDFTGPQETMTTLAERTGGRAFYNTNDITGAVRRALEDSRVTYELAFYPTHTQWNGRWRELKVLVKRPGVQVRHRRGYFALAEQELNEKDRRTLLVQAALSPLEATAFTLTVRMQPGAGMDAGKWRIEMQLNPQELQLEQKEGRWTDSLDVLILQRSAEGKVVNEVHHSVNMNLEVATYEQLRREGITLSKHVALEPTAYELRVIVRDANSGALGSVNIPLGALAPPSNR